MVAAPSDSTASTLASMWSSASSVVVLAGAGISTASGIPDYRGPDGVWTKDPRAERQSSIEHWINDPDVRRAGWQRRLTDDPTTYRPNPAHHALVALERAGAVDLLVTQNIDGLHRVAGTSDDRLVEIHGTAQAFMCLGCGDRGPIATVLDRVRAGDSDPVCESCGGILKTATVSFGQALDQAHLERAARAAGSCTLFVAVGTSLTVYPVAQLPVLAVDAGASLAIVNAQPTPLDDIASVVLHDDVAAVLTEIANHVVGVRNGIA